MFPQNTSCKAWKDVLSENLRYCCALFLPPDSNKVKTGLREVKELPRHMSQEDALPNISSDFRHAGILCQQEASGTGTAMNLNPLTPAPEEEAMHE